MHPQQQDTVKKKKKKRKKLYWKCGGTTQLDAYQILLSIVLFLNPEVLLVHHLPPGHTNLLGENVGAAIFHCRFSQMVSLHSFK